MTGRRSAGWQPVWSTQASAKGTHFPLSSLASTSTGLRPTWPGPARVCHLDAHTPGPPLQVLLCADDLVLLSRDRSGPQSLLNALHTFCATNGLRVNVDKTEAVVFGGRPRDRRPMLYLGQPVPQSKSFRYLGITMYTTTGARPAPTHPHASALAFR